MIRLFLAVLLVAAAPARADDMAFFVRNQHSAPVAVELFSHDRDTVWPGGDEVFVLDPASQKSVPISCNAGERICYGAWVVGNDSVSAGVGPDNDQPCDNCCFVCAAHSTEQIDLVE